MGLRLLALENFLAIFAVRVATQFGDSSNTSSWNTSSGWINRAIVSVVLEGETYGKCQFANFTLK